MIGVHHADYLEFDIFDGIDDVSDIQKKNPKVTTHRHIHTLGVKVRNMKMDFNTGGTRRRVGH